MAPIYTAHIRFAFTKHALSENGRFGDYHLASGLVFFSRHRGFVLVGLDNRFHQFAIISRQPHQESCCPYNGLSEQSNWLALVLVCCYSCLLQPQQVTDSHTRYLQITTPILIAVAFYGLTHLVSTFSEKWHKVQHQRLLLTSVAVGIIVFNIALNAVAVLPSSHDFSEGILQTYRDVGEWLRANTPENSRVAVAIDVGTIGYYSHREIIDLGGLNTPEAIPYLPDSLRYVFISKPQYLVVTGEETKYALLDETRFKGIAAPITSLPMQAGIRAEIDQTTGGRQNSEQYVSVYHLSW